MQLQHLRSLFLLLVFAASANAAQPDQQVTFVPWKVLNPGTDPVTGDVILNWLPATREEMRRSPLLTSRGLAQLASECVGMQVIRPDDAITIERLGATGKLPAAVLTLSDGTIVGRSESDRGELQSGAVEKMVRDSVAKLDADAEKMLDAASRTAAAGDRDSAARIYQKIIAERCLFPRTAKEAQRALKKLGL